MYTVTYVDVKDLCVDVTRNATIYCHVCILRASTQARAWDEVKSETVYGAMTFPYHATKNVYF
jgi:hypothetical protein